MNAAIGGKNFLGELAAGLMALFADGLEHLFGPGIHKAVFDSVSWADLGVTLCFLVMVLLVKGAIAAFLRRKTRLATAADSSKSWDLRCDIRERLIARVQQHN